MTVSPQGMSVQALYRHYRDGALVVNRQYQRKLVWTVAEKQSLIDSILNDYPLPLFLFAEKMNSDGKAVLEVIDGMQRLNAIFSFIEHGFKLEDRCFDIEEFARARQAADAGKFEPFPKDVQRLSAKECANMLDYQLAVTVFPGEQDSRITDVFGRINSGGKQLSDQERRQAGVLSPFAELIRTLSAEIRGDVSRETLLLSEMPEISIETGRNPHGYSLKAEDIFWCYQGVLRTGDLRDSEDEQFLADVVASILHGTPVEASGDYLNRLYTKGTDEFDQIGSLLSVYGRDRIVDEVKTIFSIIRESIDEFDSTRFAFRKLVYPKATSNAQKAPFYALFMAFHELVFKEGLAPPAGGSYLAAINDLAERIKVGQKHIKSDDRLDNVKIVSGLIRSHFTKEDKHVLAHGPGLAFDLENSIRRSRTETPRYEFKQGLLRLDNSRGIDHEMLEGLIETVCGIANVGPESNGYIYIGIADKTADASRIWELDRVKAVGISGAHDVRIVGVDRESAILDVSMDRYLRMVGDHVANSSLSDPLKTQVMSALDVITYKGLSIIRIAIPKQGQVSFLGAECYMRQGASTVKATAPQVAALIANFSRFSA